MDVNQFADIMTTHIVMVDVCKKTLTCQYSKRNNSGTSSGILMGLKPLKFLYK